MDRADRDPLNTVDRFARLFAGNQFVSPDGKGRRDMEGVESGEPGSRRNLQGIPYQRRADRGPMAHPLEEAFVERQLLSAPME